MQGYVRYGRQWVELNNSLLRFTMLPPRSLLVENSRGQYYIGADMGLGRGNGTRGGCYPGIRSSQTCLSHPSLRPPLLQYWLHGYESSLS
jgi:hypothetical protein